MGASWRIAIVLSCLALAAPVAFGEQEVGASAGFSLRVTAGLAHIRSPLIEAVKRDGFAWGAEVSFRVSPSVAVLAGMAGRHLGGDTSSSGFDVVPVGVRVQFSPLASRHRLDPYVMAGAGAAYTVWTDPWQGDATENLSEVAATFPLTAGLRVQFSERSHFREAFVEVGRNLTLTDKVFPSVVTDIWSVQFGIGVVP